MPVQYTPQPLLVPPEGAAALFGRAGDPVRWTLADVVAITEVEPSDELARQGYTAVVVTGESIAVAAKEVLRLADGRIPAGAVKAYGIPPLVEALRTADRDEVLLLADGGLRQGDLVAVLASASQAGAWRRFVAVRDPADPPGTASGAFAVWGPWYTAGAQPEAVPPSVKVLGLDVRKLVLYMRVTDAAVELGELLHTGEFRGLGRVTREEGWEPIRRIARDAAARDTPDEAGIVVFGAERNVPLARVVAALTAITGERCGGQTEDRGLCWFSARFLVGGEMSLRTMSEGLGSLTVVEREQRSMHPSGYCSGSVRQGSTTVELGRWMNQDIEEVSGEWLVVETEQDGRTTVRVIPPWREMPWNWEGPDRAIKLTEDSGCARYKVELAKHHVYRSASGEVDLDCTIGDVTVRGRVRFSGCPMSGE